MPHPTITHTVDVHRLTRTGNRDAYSASPIASGLDVAIIPASTDIIAVYGGQSVFSLYEIYTTENVTLRNGDKLSANGREWIVRDAPQVVENRYLHFTRVIGQEVA